MNKKEKIIGIYKLTSPTGRIYIGQSTHIYQAWIDRYCNYNCKTQRRLYNSLKKYGWDSHKKEIIHILGIYNKEELNLLEIYYGELYNVYGENGLNLRKCGGSKGSHSPETKRLMSEAQKGNKNHNFGKSPSLETRKKISLIHTGRKASIETRKKQSDAVSGDKHPMFGKSHSKEARLKVSKFHKGRKRPKETGEKISIANSGEGNGMFGKKHSEDVRRRISESSKGEKNHFFGKKHSQKTIEAKSRIILNTQTGIFYIGLQNAVNSVNNIKSPNILARRLRGEAYNDTNFIYA